MSRWFAHRGQTQIGPFSAMELRRALRDGQVDPFTEVFNEENPNDVRPLLEWDEVFQVAAVPPQTKEVLEKNKAASTSEQVFDPFGLKQKLTGDENQKFLEPGKKAIEKSQLQSNEVISGKDAGEKANPRQFDNLNLNESTRTSRLAGDGGHTKNQPRFQIKSPVKPQDQGKDDSRQFQSKENDGLSASSIKFGADKSKNLLNIGIPMDRGETTRSAINKKFEKSSEYKQPPKQQAQTDNSNRKYYLHLAGKKAGPFESRDIIQAFKVGKIDSRYFVSRKNNGVQMNITKFVGLYQKGRESAFIPVAAAYNIWSRYMGWAVAVVLLLVTLFLMSPSGSVKLAILHGYGVVREASEQFTESRKSNSEDKLKGSNQNGKSSTPELTEADLRLGVMKPLDQVKPVQKNNAIKGVRPGPPGGIAKTNQGQSPAGDSSGNSPSSMAAKALPTVVSSIRQVTKGKPNGSLVSFEGLFFDPAALRKCSSRCELTFLDSVGGSIQVVLDVRAHRGKLMQARGRASIKGYLSNQGKKIILKQVN